MLEILYSKVAVKNLKQIQKGDIKGAKRIILQIETYASDPTGMYDIKQLKGREANFKRLRVGNYRIIFDEEDRIMTIYEIKHRQEVYNG